MTGMRIGYGLIAVHLLIFLLVPAIAPPAWAAGENPLIYPGSEDVISEAEAEALQRFVIGEWAGARLLCRKEENDDVRCGKPEKFTVTFVEDGKGSSNDDSFPGSFTYSWKSRSAMVVSALPDGREIELFQMELKKGLLSFQAYIFMPLEDSSLPKEARYIHYIFDVSRIE